MLGENTVFQTYDLNSKSYNFGHVNTSLESIKVINEDDLLEMIKARPGSSDAPPPVKTPKRKKKEESAEESPVSNKMKKTEKAKVSPVSEKAKAGEKKKTAEKAEDIKPVDYCPTTIKQVVGQQGDKSCLNKLIKWLRNWHKYHAPGAKPARPALRAKDDDGGFYNAALLSGPPGIG
ncbi:hypothetical protein QYM36_009242 [Artemia franciscana]|uniref:Uncharacterized protein n=1 Tax=Artemia franciscana TaxID=6661 RepID=A0AA88HW96_ARTSF|nr:hypothetical protein QYM36_009242 [Artemia franciscana]